MPVIYLGLGSNVGDREKNLRDAVRLLAAYGVKELKLSTIIETAPVGGPPQGLFLNAVIKADTRLGPEDLLKAARQVEFDLGRVRTVKDGPRTIDIDILLYEGVALETPELCIPHPRMKERAFVMGPLHEVGGC